MQMISIAVLCLVLLDGRLVAGNANCRSKCVSGEPTTADPNPERSTYRPEIDDIYNELPCAMQGGLCVIKTDCSPDKVTEVSGLCPNQAAKNVECCYGISIKEKRCRKYGGQCVDAASGCTRVIDKQKIDDCAPAEICCLLT